MLCWWCVDVVSMWMLCWCEVGDCVVGSVGVLKQCWSTLQQHDINTIISNTPSTQSSSTPTSTRHQHMYSRRKKTTMFLFEKGKKITILHHIVIFFPLFSMEHHHFFFLRPKNSRFPSERPLLIATSRVVVVHCWSMPREEIHYWGAGR